MKRYFIFSDRYEGQAELIYNEGILKRIDVGKAEMWEGDVAEFKKIVPVNEVLLVSAFQGFATRIIEGEIEITFEQWWKKYNHKINKARCIPIFNKLTNADQLKAYSGIDVYDAFLKKETWRKKLDPENYLKNKTWENEYK